MTGKIQPQAIELEKAILGALLLESESVTDVMEILTPSDFYVEAHAIICEEIFNQHSKGNRIDFLTIGENLKGIGKFEIVGGAYGITALTENVASSANIIEHARIVKERSISRQLIRIGAMLVSQGYAEEQDCFELMDSAEGLISGIRSGIETEKMQMLGEVAIELYEDTLEQSKKGDDLFGLPTGYNKLDEILGGLAEPDLTILAAGTGEGKSTLALNIAGNIADKEPVAYYSLEMKAKQLALKYFADILNKSMKDIRVGKVSESDFEKLVDGVSNLQKSKLYIKDKGGLSIIQLKNSIRSVVRKKGVKIVFIDYLQLITTKCCNEKFGTREREVSYISKELKSLCMDLNISIVALSQLSRLATVRLYVLSDLRESGAIEQDADNVIFIWNPQKHKVSELKIDGSIKLFETNEVLLQIEKCRLGDVGVLPMKFYGVRQRFEDFTPMGNKFRPLTPNEKDIFDKLDVPF